MLFRHFLDIFLFENDLSLGRVFVLVLAASTRVQQLPKIRCPSLSLSLPAPRMLIACWLAVGTSIKVRLVQVKLLALPFGPAATVGLLVAAWIPRPWF
jgi:hypothetical protein